MRGRPYGLLCLLAALTLRAADDARAGDAADPVAAAAERVRDAVRRTAAKDLEALAARDEPDPWLVADRLLALGAKEEAAAFAGAAPRPDVEGLPRYVREAPEPAAEEAARKAFDATWKAAGERKPAQALEAAGEGEASPRTVTEVRLAFQRVFALRDLKRLREAADLCAGLETAATEMGWLVTAAGAADEGRRLCWRLPNLPRAL